MFYKDHIRFGVRVTIILVLMMGMQTAKSVLADTVIVTNTNDLGPGSLRQAILDAAPGDTITFSPSLAGQTIALSSQIDLDKDLIIDGSGLDPAVEISGSLGARIFYISFDSIVTLNLLVFKDGRTSDSGGGAIFNDGNLTITDSTFINNATTGAGGAILNKSTLHISGSTFLSNSASSGGAIYLDGSIFRNQTSYTIVNSTFVSNQANLATGLGGAVFNMGNTLDFLNTNLLVLTDNTFSGNSAYQGGGLLNWGNLAFHNNIFANSPSGGDCVNFALTGMVTGSQNLIEDGVSCSPDPFISGDPLLGPLADNGGPTKTMALLPGSPAIEANEVPCISTDQRGVTRPQGAACEIGAYEYQPVLRYVNWNASGANNGTSWTDAYTDLQSALAVAASGDEIWVAAGTYRPTHSTDRAISFTLKNGVAVYGGFAGTETSRDQRDYEANLTVLSGDIGAAGDSSDNSYHVLVGSNTNHSAILDGFTVTAGNADGIPSSQQDLGGGMYIDKGSPRLNQLIFIDNHARFGGGIYAVHTEGNDHTVDLILTNVVFRNNTASGEGGGMATLFMPDLSSASFSLNLTGVTFENNTAVRTGGGLINNGGQLTLENVTFSGNTAAGGGGLSNIPFGPSTLTDVTFSNNSASDGGGGMLVGSSGVTLTTLTNVTFNDNSTAMNGGGLVNAGLSDLILTNVTFRDNTAGLNGGGISNGGILGLINSGTISVINTTLTNNTANSSGSAVYNESGTINVHNSILYGNSGEEISGAATVNHSIVEGGYAGLGNLDADPRLGPLQDNGGFTETMALSAGSPAIDAASNLDCPATDQRGVTRPQGSHCDMGAYEAAPDTTPPTVLSMVRASPTPTSAPTVTFTVTFSESVTGVAADDFAWRAFGSVSGASIQSVSGSGSVYTVTVNTGSGFGTLHLDVPNTAAITDLAGNPMSNLPFITGEPYTIARNKGADTTGVFRPSNGALYLKNTHETGFADIQINYGIGGDYPVVGDWDLNPWEGTVTIGVYRNATFYLRDSNTIGFADVVFPFGMPGDQPIAGDWDGDGTDTVGVYRNGTFFLRNENSAGAPDMIFALGIPGDIAIAGDWDGDGKDTTGVFRPSNGALYLKNSNTTGFADIQINYGIAGDKPVTGDWNYDGVDTIGVYRNGTFYLRNSNTIGFADVVFALGIPGDHPIAGNWDGLP